jgi:hypothetical protein
VGSIFWKFFRRATSRTKTSQTPVPPLDYEKMILLDAEELAEQGIAEAYQRLLPDLSRYIAHPADLTEIVDSKVPSYRIRCDGQEYLVYSAEEPGTETEGWGRATYVFFLIVNRQLVGTGVQLYAINAGNDLGALFLEPEDAKSVQSALPKKTDWPYIPTLDDAWYGQFH